MDYFVKIGSKAYSPRGVRDLFEQAVKNENNNIEIVLLNKHKYKKLLELWYASFLAFAINKWLNRKFYLQSPEQDPPDILFLDQETKEAFPVEVMELYVYGQEDFNDNYPELVQRVWDAKGNTKFNQCHLLLVNRQNTSWFNVAHFSEEIRKKVWQFEKIWFVSFVKKTLEWNFFEVLHSNKNKLIDPISVSTLNSEDMNFWF